MMNLDRRLLSQARRSLFALISTILLGAAAGFVTVWQAHSLSQIVSQVFLAQVPFNQLSSALIGLLLLMLGRAGLGFAQEAAAQAVARRVKGDLRRLAFDHLLAAGPVAVRRERFGELSSVLMEGIEALEAYFSQYLPQLVLAALVPLTILAFVWPVDWLSGLILLLTAPLIPLFMILIGNAAQTLTRRQWLTLSRMNAYFLDVLRGLTTLKALGRSREQVQVVAQVSDRYRQVTMGVLRVTFLSALVLEMLSTLSTAVVAVQIGLRLLVGQLEFAQAFFILLLAPEFYFPIRLLGTRFHASMAGVNAAKRLFALLDLPIEGDGGVSTGSASGLLPSSPARLEFRGVTAAYQDRPALAGVTLEIQPGEKIALVGPSGSGKSTLANLLLRFLTPQQGQILVDGKPLAEIPREDWLQQVAWVPQQPVLLNATILENIRFGRPEASLEEIYQAAELAGAAEFIQALPRGYDTPVGEAGDLLSGGQAQRIALARAFLRRAWLVILDEPTAHLDAESESRLQHSLERLLVGRTAIVIAHRLTTAASADRVIVLEGGRVAQVGKHAELWEQDGLYRQLLRAALQEPSQPAEPPALQAVPSRPVQVAAAVDLLPASSPLAGSVGSAALVEDGRVRPWSALRRLLHLARPFVGWMSLAVLCGFLAVGSQMGLLGASAYIISAAALHPSIAELQVAIVGVRFFGLSRGIFRYLERYLSHQVTFLILARLRVWIYQALEPLAPARLQTFRRGDLLARLQADIEVLENFYVRSLAPPATAALVSAATVLFLSAYHSVLGLTLLGLYLLGGGLLPLGVRWLSRGPAKRVVTRRAALQAELLTALQGLAEMWVFGQIARQRQKVEAASQALLQVQAQQAVLSAAQNATSSFLASFSLWMVLTLCIPQVEAGELAGVLLAPLCLIAWSSFEAILPLPLAGQYLESNLQAARRLFELVDAQPAVRDPAQPRSVQPPLTLEVKDLWFRYPPAAELDPPLEAQTWALQALSFRLVPGGRLALVGPSGAGKSTLVSLLLRFWDYSAPSGRGEILLNGVELRQLVQDDVRRLIGVVSQRTELFSGTIADNLRLGRPSASQGELEWAARQAQLHDFIVSLPEGYRTWVGDEGMQLSGGQRQRLAIARLLLQEAPLWILDEPTAHLDPLTERELLRSLERLSVGRTTLWITHRLIGMEQMDEILVLDGGRVVQRGRHAELLAGGLYRRLWERQNGMPLSLV